MSKEIDFVTFNTSISLTSIKVNYRSPVIFYEHPVELLNRFYWLGQLYLEEFFTENESLVENNLYE